MDCRSINNTYEEIGKELIETEEVLQDLKDSDVNIIFLSSEHRKKKAGMIVKGQCEKVAEKYKWGIPCDFTITIFEPNTVGMSDEQMRILILHELLHIGIDGDKYYVRDHDLSDFKYIIEKYGTDWSVPQNGKED